MDTTVESEQYKARGDVDPSVVATTPKKYNSDTYVTITRRGEKVTEEGHVNERLIANPGLSISTGSDRDISAAMNLPFMSVTDLHLKYPDNSECAVLALSDVILEARSNVGVLQTKGGQNNPWRSIYLETYASIGVPEKVYEWLRSSISKTLYGHEAGPDLLKPRHSEGHYWINVKLTREPQPFYFIAYHNGERRRYDHPVDIMRTCKKNIVGNAYLYPRMFRTNKASTNMAGSVTSINLTMACFQLASLTATGPGTTFGPSFVYGMQKAISSEIATLLFEEA